MAGTQAGGKKAAAKNLAKDPNFYAKIGAKGGKTTKTRTSSTMTL
jgi:general stress protein YciG